MDRGHAARPAGDGHPSVRDPAIRAAVAADHPTLVAIWERAVRATHDFLTAHDVEALRPEVVAALASGALELWVLTAATGQPLGWLGLTGAHIEALFLDPDARGAGNGRRLIAHAQARRPGALTVDVNEQNPAATGFYRRLGFAVTGRSPRDGAGRPFPILHLRRPAEPPADRA